MTVIVREPIKTIWCQSINDSATLIEERVHPGDSLALVGAPDYRVLRQECSHGVECNLIGCACRWSFLNPDYDPFPETSAIS
jgi:hypothetical protein